MSKLTSVFLPFEKADRKTTIGIALVWGLMTAAFWIAVTARGGDSSRDLAAFFPFLNGNQAILPTIPNPVEVYNAFWSEMGGGLLAQLLGSLRTSVEAIILASVVGLAIVYAATMAAFRPPAILIGTFRFLSLAGITVIFMMMLNDHALKVGILAFSMMTFFVADMLQTIDDIPQSEFDHVKTLGYNRGQIVFEVVIMGTLAAAFEAIRKNAAIAWMMLTSVESLVRSEGGIGLLLITLQRSGNYMSIFAVQLMIFAVGIGQDRLLKYLKIVACPYTQYRR